MKKLLILLMCLAVSGAFGQSTLTVNKSTGAITGPVSASTFLSINSIQPLDTDLTSWAAISRGTGFDTAAAINVGSAGAFVTFNGAGGTPSSLTGTNISGTAANLTAGNVTNVAVATTFATDNTVVPTNDGGWTTYYVTGSDATTTSTTIVDIAGLISGTLSNNVRYDVEVVLILLNAADTAGIKVGMQANGGGTVSLALVAMATTSSSTAATSFSQTANSTLSNALDTVSGQTGIYFARGSIVASSTGTATISVGWAKVTSLTATCKVGSTLKIRKSRL